MAFYHFARAVARVVFRIPYKIDYVNLDNIPEKGGLILASNHHTLMDPIYVALGPKREVHFMAKEELFKNPVLRFFVLKLNAFPVSRGKGDRSAIDKAVGIVKSGEVLGIFPEGTRSKDGKLMRLKSGVMLIASETGGDIVPVGIRYGEKKKFRRQKITVTYGELIKNEEFKITEGSRAELKNANELLHGRISALLSGDGE